MLRGIRPNWKCWRQASGLLLASLLSLGAAACSQRVITPGVAEGSLVWFGEVYLSGGSSDTNIIVCHRSAIPACLRVPIRDAHTKYAEWRETALENDRALFPPDGGPTDRSPAPPSGAPRDGSSSD